MAAGLGTNGLTIAALGIRGLFPVLVARAFGGEILGAWALSWFWIDGLSKFAALGLDSAATAQIAGRLAHGRHDAAAAVARRSLQLGLTSGLLVAATAIAITWNAATQSTGSRVFWQTFAVMATALPFLAVRRISNGVSFARLHMRHDLYSRALADAAGFLAVFVPGVALGFGPLTAAVATASGSAVGGVTAWRLARKGIHAAAPDPASTDTRELLRYSLPIGGYGLLNILLTRLDVLIVGFFAGTTGIGAASFGVYCAASEIAGGLRKIRQAFDPIFTPIAARQVASGVGAEESSGFTRSGCHSHTMDESQLSASCPGARWMAGGSQGVLVASTFVIMVALRVRRNESRARPVHVPWVRTARTSSHNTDERS
jgi:O-antigen/teichoic acid export membrane protein